MKILHWVLVCMFSVVGIANAATTRAMRSGTSAVERMDNPTAAYTYNYMYPYLNNDMRATLNPGVIPSQNNNPINAVVRTEQLSAPRRVVARPNAAAARAATNTTAIQSGGTTTARGATGTVPGAPVRAAKTATNRRVVARSAANAATARASRADNYYLANAAANAANMEKNTNVAVSSSRCLADYTECMEGYCRRENMAYNRCYCSSKLSQIDSKYKDNIDAMIKHIISIQGTNQWSQAEMNEYWMSVIGKYTGQNSWENLDAALNIDWTGTESRVRGQQSFVTGHEYCMQHLSNCFYMAGNMRDAYVSQINRDCQTYEQSLQRLHDALDSVIRNYND